VKLPDRKTAIFSRNGVLAALGLCIGLFSLIEHSAELGWTQTGGLFSAEEFLEPIKFLSSDQLKGRGDGTKELDLAGDYIADHFRNFGLKPGGDNGKYLQHFDLVVGAKLGRKNVVVYRQGEHSEKLNVEEAFVPLSFSASASIEAPLVFAGYGITAPEYHYDDYQGLDVSGRIAIVLRHEPQENDEHSVFAGRQLTSHSEIANKATNAKNHGAKAMVLVSDLGNHPGQGDELLSLDEVSGPQEMTIPVIQVKAEAVNEWLKPSGHTLEEFRQAIDKDLSNHSMALDPSGRLALTVEIERIHRKAANVIAELPGSEPSLADQYIVVGAHYDHLGLGEHDSLAPRLRGQIHHGADDNASGTSGVLELADALAHAGERPRHSVVFICFAGEELGLLGSAYYANHATFPLERTVAMINMDMIGRVSSNRLYIGGTGTSPNFQKLVEDANSGVKFALSYSASGYGASDQTSFAVHEVPVLFFFSGLHSDYHKPSDTWDKIDATNGARVVELVWHVFQGLDALRDKPQYVRVSEPLAPAMGGGGGYGPYFGSIPDFGQVEHGGVRFSDVRDGSPAGKAGFKAGDVLVEFDGKTIDNLYDFTYALRAHKPGDKVTVTVLRGNERVTREVTLEVRK
jgi:aminopeptidase YwaD